MGYGQYPSTQPGYAQAGDGMIAVSQVSVRPFAQAVVNADEATRDMYFGYYNPTGLPLPDYAGVSRPDESAQLGPWSGGIPA